MYDADDRMKGECQVAVSGGPATLHNEQIHLHPPCFSRSH